MEIELLVNIRELEINKNSIHITKKTGLWCKLPYKNHKKGCYHYGNNLLCPPNSPYFKDIINNYNYFYLIYAIFDFKKYKKMRSLENPEFFNSKERLKCVIYWQNSVKRVLKNFVKYTYIDNYNIASNFYLLGCGSGFNDKLLNKFQNTIYSMESVGIDVFRTLRNNNIDFELKPINKVVLVCLLCSKVNLYNETNSSGGGLF
ncbi:hypothetical protein LCGC14_0560020 [marine sediment metagenome]|uniref:DUF2284 domain-containing protein n=1 Tax=marine sediment metagenome TaxID=412755 RepID=A0A0F9RM40_9ZZZZ